jgi:hypothetical protein
VGFVQVGSGKRALLLAGAALACACAGPSAQTDTAARNAGPKFTDATLAAGIRHVHRRPALDPQLSNIMPWMSSVGAAAAAGDFDRDGAIDLYVTQSDKGAPNLLYRNGGDGTFTDVAAAAGVDRANDDGGASMDCIWADVDNDGWLDLYVVRWGRDILYRNDRDGTFTDVTAERFRRPDGTPGTPWANGNAVVALDYDRDGLLDLYVGNYFRDVDLWHLASTKIMHDSFETARNAGPNFLYHQQADGTFREVAVELGVADTGWTLAVGAADLDNDGWPDIYVANDFGPDRLFFNDGQGGFVDASEAALGRDTRKGMNVDFGDFNNDGWLDVYVTNITTAEYLQEGNMLWRNNGPGPDGLTRFMDVAPESGTYDGGWGWGGKFLDHDLDGDLDLFTVNGFISAGDESYWYDLASWTVLGQDPADSRNWPPIGDKSFSGHEPSRFFRNDGHETFREMAVELGVASTRDGRGIVVWDPDDDGDPDLYVANQGQAPHFYRNDGASPNHWIGFALEADPATGTNADAIGTRITVVTEAGRQIRERDGGTGFSGQSDPRPLFGLGQHDRAELVEVRWPDGGIQYLEDPPVDRYVTIRQDPASYVSRPTLPVDAPARRDRAPAEPARDVPRMDPAELERMLSMMERELAGSIDHETAHRYRKRAADHDVHDRAIAFFEERVAREPENRAARLELNVAYVDKIPTCGGIAAIVCKGTLARKSLDQLDVLVERDPDDWLALYARGTNHLHWPRALRHTPDAVRDFERAIELARRTGVTPQHERLWVLLGDARAKAGSPDGARQAWRDGLEAFPASRELTERLAIAPEDLRTWIEGRRSLEQPIDTDLSFAGGTP